MLSATPPHEQLRAQAAVNNNDQRKNPTESNQNKTKRPQNEAALPLADAQAANVTRSNQVHGTACISSARSAGERRRYRKLRQVCCKRN
jgi:hypothetical protein